MSYRTPAYSQYIRDYSSRFMWSGKEKVIWFIKNFEQSKPMYEYKILYTKNYLKIPVCTAVEVVCDSKDFLLKSNRPYFDLKEVRQTKVACKTPNW